MEQSHPAVDVAPGEIFKTAIYSSLLQLQQQTSSGLAAQIQAGLEQRLIELIPGEASWQVHIASDGLNLEQKIIVERGLLGDLQRAFPHNRFSIYFRRLQTPPPLPNSARMEPMPVSSQAAPFGLKFKRKAIAGVRDVVVVASGKGGVGKSTVSANLAIALANQGQKVGLLDADIYGPSGPTMLGLKGPLALDEEGKLLPLMAFGVKTVSFGFLSDAYHPVIWRGPLVAKAIEQLCFHVQWGELDTLIVDLPPGTGDVQLTLIENLPLQGALIVTTPQDVALIDAHKALSMFETLEVPVFGLVENMTAYTCPRCGHEEAIFGEGGGSDFSQERKLPMIAQIPLDPSIRLACDTGQPIGSQKHRPQAKIFAQLAKKIAQELEP